MNDEVKLWLQILTEGRIAIAPDQAHAILWLAIGNAALAIERAIRAAAPAPAPTKPGLAKTKPTKRAGRKASPKSATGQVLAAIKAGARDYKAISVALPKVPTKYLYRACDQLVQRGAITRTRTGRGKEVILAAR